MKRNGISQLLQASLCACAIIISASSCEDFFSLGKQGSLTVSFLRDNDLFNRGYTDGPVSKGSLQSSPGSLAHVPDTNDFIIEITDSKGRSIYKGKYGALPSPLPLDAGTYTISARSSESEIPMFDSPLFGDTRSVTVKSSQNSKIELVCTQLNAGIRLIIGKSFLTEYPDGVLFMKSAKGKLMYGYSETRTAYFSPGNVSVALVRGESEKILVSKNLSAQQMLTLAINVSSPSGPDGSGNGISITMDTTRTWITDDYNLGGNGADGKSTSGAYGIEEARNHSGEEEVWIYGYIVGGDLSSSRCSFNAPFTSRTNIVLAGKSSCTDRSICMSVQLSKGDIRDELNLVDHEDNLGRQLFLKGDIVESYYGLPGLQNISEYKWK